MLNWIYILKESWFKRSNTSNLAAKSDLISLKAEANQTDLDKKLKAVLTDLSKLSNVVDKDVIKITVLDELNWYK